MRALAAVAWLDIYLIVWGSMTSTVRRLRLCDTSPYDVGVLLLRLMLGLTMAAHGYNKFFGKGGLKGTAGWFDSMGMKPGKFPCPGCCHDGDVGGCGCLQRVC